MLKSTFYAMLQPIYPLLIQQFVDDYHLMEGIAVDIGTGPGFLGIEMAKITHMKIEFVDIDGEALEKLKTKVATLNLDNECDFIEADVSRLPYKDNYADFIMSRGSIWFWEEPEKGLREIQRVLKPGGVAIIGGGLGRYIPETMRKRLIEEKKKHKGPKGPDFAGFSSILNEGLAKKAGLLHYIFIKEDAAGKSGKWVEIRKK